MPKIITLTTLNLSILSIDYVNQFVEARIELADATGFIWDRKVCKFWITLPPNPDPVTDFQLPASYVPTLVQLQTDAKAALTARLLT